MKYIKKFENISDETQIGDEVICTGYGVFDPKSDNLLLEHARTYIIEDINEYNQFKLKNIDYWWESERFELRRNLSQMEIDHYDSIIAKIDAKKYNI